ncbi:MAG: glycoside hydrolase family 32 protein [Anaerolineae bacterium]|nr:glycoside hydrolase family 32 protein [Anaerolineae bacterium]
MTSDRYRPQFHFTPLQNWMNDPNGLVYFNGEYHLFYQYNPYDRAWGHMHWGHAVGPDLVHWHHLPVALHEETDTGITMFSGCAVVDWQDTSGFGSEGRPAIIATYTGDHRPVPLEDIHIAYSTDLGRSFTKYAGNPVIDAGSPKFGDPKVFWHEKTKKWIMVNILGNEQGCVVLYGSTDFRNWRYLSRFEAPSVAPAIWECPDLFPLTVDGDTDDIRWMLKINNTDPTGQQTWYFVGEFDGTTFTSESTAEEAAGGDYGEIYAEVTYNDILAADGRRILIGWIRQQPMKERPWTGAQSIPRVLSLHRGKQSPVLRQTPVEEMKALRREHHHWDTVTLLETPPEPTRRLVGGEMEIEAEFEAGDASDFGLHLQMSAGGWARIGYSTADRRLFVDQENGKRVEAPYSLTDRRLHVHVFIDHNLIEVFAGDGETVITTALEPDPLCETVSLYTRGGRAQLIALNAWNLSSALERTI